ncbi:MAG: outer membrane protein transport protein [Candidatus Cloacimonetes bacterium]|nr:outer membrane protein transport protein [Candidatus Cloacimonadota bacterium]
MNLKKTTLLVFAFVFTGTLLLANGLSLNSPGPRALSMGGAFVGLADDASAIYWNPAALARQSTSLKAILTDVIPISNYKYSAAANDAEGVTNHFFNPNFFFNYRMNKMAFGLGIYVPAGLGAEYEGKDLAPFAGNAPGSNDIEWMSKIGVVNFSPAFAYSLNDKLSLGIALNMYYGMFELKRASVKAVPEMEEVFVRQYSEESDGLGFSGTFAVKYDHNEMFSAGLTLRLPTKVTLSGEAENGLFALSGAPTKSDFDRDVTWPMWIGAGVAVRPFDKLTITFDAQYSQWSELDKLTTEFKEQAWIQASNESGENIFHLEWEDQTQIRLGLKHQTTECLELMLGYYYDPAPAPDETLNVLFPSSTNHVITGGFGYKWNKFCLDFGAEYLFGAERDVKAAAHNMPGTHHLDVFAYSIGLGYNF